MDLYEVLDRVVELLRSRRRVTYRLLRRQFNLDEATLEDLKDEILFAHPQVQEEGDRGLVWTGDTEMPGPTPPQPAQHLDAQEVPSVHTPSPPAVPHPSDAERRQLTVMFCDLVGSTPLSEQLDPEDLREVVRAYQHTCTEVVQHFDGHIAQLLGDALLVYFGWPRAHEDDAQRAVRTGLGMLAAMGTLNTRLERDIGIRLAIRVGIHTGVVVVGEMGGGGHQEQLALGETPNVAARLQGIADPDTIVISETTYRLIEGYFTCQALGTQTLKGMRRPMPVYHVLGDSGARSRLDIITPRGLTPLVGREPEVGLLLERWQQARGGRGQMVLLSGEAGIGKSRLLQVLKDQIAAEPHTRLECRSSPYYQHTALYPITDLLHRILQWQPDESAEQRLEKLAYTLSQYRLSLEETVPLFATLLSLPLSADRYPPLTWTPQRQRQRTLASILALLLEQSERQPVLLILEDVHWADPSTLEWLGLLLEQAPTASLLALLTCRPEFEPPWGFRSHLTPLALHRFTRVQIETMVQRVTGGKMLPAEVVQHLVEKTDGVPLYIEEMTKAILESGVLQETAGQYVLTSPLTSLAIPATLQDSLMARLDRLGTAKRVAQLGATIGRQFSYELLRAVAPVDEATLQRELGRLVEAELVYQRGALPQATYTFKHALIQDTAYQSLLRSTRQQVHQHIAQVLAEQFSAVVETQPELLAHHYTAAGCAEQAVHYWQQAGQYASDRSAHLEAISHVTTGIELLKTLPETPSRLQQALTMHIALGAALQITKGMAAPEVEHAYTQARTLCQQVDETPELVPVLFGLWRYYIARPQLHTAREIGETLLRLAQSAHDPALSVLAHSALGATWFWLGAFSAARQHLEEAIAGYTPDQCRAPVFRIGQDLGVACQAHAARTLWGLGYPAQALTRFHDALTLAQELSHPYSLVFARCWAAVVSQCRRDVLAVHAQADATVALATEQGFTLWVAVGTTLRGWALAMQGKGEAGLAQVRQGIAAYRATGAATLVPYLCTVLAEVSAHLGHPEDGLQALAEAHTLVEQHDERWWEAEVHRLRGVLLLQQTATYQEEAEACFQQALTVARHQHAKSLELRSTTSLARLWQRQGRHQDASDLLAPVYNWFTEGFDTADFQEARALLEELA